VGFRQGSSLNAYSEFDAEQLLRVHAKGDVRMFRRIDFIVAAVALVWVLVGISGQVVA